MNLEFKRFGELHQKELLEVYKLRSDVFVVEQKCVYLDPDQTDVDSIHVSGKTKGDLAAYARIYIDQTAHIGRVIVDENHRGKGLAKQLMLECISWIKHNTQFKEIEISGQVYLRRDVFRRWHPAS
jgi:ElaA protein